MFLLNHPLSILVSTCQSTEFLKVTKSTLLLTCPLLRMFLISSLFLANFEFLQNHSTVVEPLFRLTRKRFQKDQENFLKNPAVEISPLNLLRMSQSKPIIAATGSKKCLPAVLTRWSQRSRKPPLRLDTSKLS